MREKETTRESEGCVGVGVCLFAFAINLFLPSFSFYFVVVEVSRCLTLWRHHVTHNKVCNFRAYQRLLCIVFLYVYRCNIIWTFNMKAKRSQSRN